MHCTYSVCRNTGTVARGLYSWSLYKDRFNLNIADLNLVKAAAATYVGLPTCPEISWGFYLRFLLRPKHFYRFLGLHPPRYVMCAENKSLPGRDKQPEGAALGRPMSIAWFEEVSTTIDGVVVKPVAESANGELKLMLSSIAELARAAGYYPAIPADSTARESELILERGFLTNDLVEYQSCEQAVSHD